MQRSIDARGVVRLLLVLGTVIGLPAGAHATTFVLMDEGDLAARSVAAVLGTVSAVRSDSAANGAIVTAVVIDPEQVVLGALPPGAVTLRERGGTVGRRTERIFGSAQYQIGERVLVFLSRGIDGSLHTTGMAMGKYRVDGKTMSDSQATRAFDGNVAVFDRVSGRLQPAAAVEVKALPSLLRRLRAHHVAAAPSPLPAGVRYPLPPRLAPAFTYLGEPARWFEPDDGIPIRISIDPAGDATLGATASVAAAVDALAAWGEVGGTSMMLVDANLDRPLPFAGCDGDNRVVFNDPFDEIDPPVGCSGVLGVGGYCTTDETRTVNDTTFRRIALGKVMIANGFAGCPFWNACSLAEIITHEVGHAIGLGHSRDDTATMYAAPPLDGRCGALGADDIDGVRFIYPSVSRPPPTPTPTATSIPSSTPTATRRETRTANATPRHAGTSTMNGRIRYAESGLAVPGVTLDLRGAAPQRDVTEAGGRFVFTNVPDGKWLLEPSKSGDAGNAVSALDAAWVLQAVAGIREMTPAQRVACDVTGNGDLSALDAARILQRTLGQIDRFQASELCGSDWLFLPVPAPVSSQTIVPPSFGSFGCQRGGVMLNPLQGDADDQDFSAAVIGDCTGNWRGSGADSAEAAAPPGTALEMLPPRRRPGGRWLQPIAVRAPGDVHSLELELRYDPSRLRLTRVRATPLANPHVLLASPHNGRVSIAIASAHPFPRDGRALFVVEFSSGREMTPELVRATAVSIDEHLVSPTE